MIQPRSRSIAVIATLFYATTAFADQPKHSSLGKCPPPENFGDLVAWVKEVDSLGLTRKQFAEKGDYQSQLGPILQKSCFSGDRAEKREEIIARYEKLFAELFAQTGLCYRLLGFPELTGAI